MTSCASALTAHKLRRLPARVSFGFVERECSLFGVHRLNRVPIPPQSHARRRAGGRRASLARAGRRLDVTLLHDTVFLIDVDNTLLDNDRVEQDLRAHLTAAVGAEQQQRYWVIFESLRAETGYADYLGALQRYRAEHLPGSDPVRPTQALVTVDRTQRGGAGIAQLARRWSSSSSRLRTPVLSAATETYPFELARSCRSPIIPSSHSRCSGRTQPMF